MVLFGWCINYYLQDGETWFHQPIKKWWDQVVFRTSWVQNKDSQLSGLKVPGFFTNSGHQMFSGVVCWFGNGWEKGGKSIFSGGKNDDYDEDHKLFFGGSYEDVTAMYGKFQYFRICNDWKNDTPPESLRFLQDAGTHGAFRNQSELSNHLNRINFWAIDY